MNGFVAAAGLLPIIAFVIADSFYQQKKAIIAAVLVSLVSYFAYWAVTGDNDLTMLAEVVFFAVLGWASLKWDNPTFFKYQPAIVGFSMAAFLAWFEIRGESYLVQIVPRMVALNPSFEPMLNNPEIIERMKTLSFRLCLLLAAHACLMVYTARKKNSVWLATRIAIYPAALILAMTIR
jgi:intracellular septation protein A